MMFSNFFVEELPMILLKNFSANNAAVGLFSKARGLGRKSRVVTVPVSQVLFPFTAASEEEEATRRTNVLCRNSLLVMALGVGLVALCVKPLIRILYGEPFLPAAKIFYALAPGVFLWPLGRFLGTHVAASGRPRWVFVASLGALAASTVSSWLLIPDYGAVGAGLSVSVIYAVQSVLRLVVYMRSTGAAFSEIVLPRRGDWVHYQHILKTLSSGLAKKPEVV